MIPWVYDLGLHVLSVTLDVFFREVSPRNSFRVPNKGPVILVAAPHANQFVDSLVLMQLMKKHVDRRISFLIAEKSLHEPYIGTIAGALGNLPVTRAMDHVRPGQGTIYLPSPERDPTRITGVDTDFTGPDFMVGGSIILPKIGKAVPESQYIEEIVGPTELRLRAPFQTPHAMALLTPATGKRTKFKVAPHIDQKRMFASVWQELSQGACIGIFPEGGSHDRSDLLPLKAGVAIMALGALSQDPNCGLSIIPCGMNYFHAHKFRSRAVIEFGHPIDVHPDQVKAYEAGGAQKRNAIGSLLETINDGLAAVTQPSPDHETLQLIQATRRLYKPIGKKLPLPLVVQWNRRLLKGYTRYRDDPRVVRLKKAVLDYNVKLRALGIKDHQVEWGNITDRPWLVAFATLLYRLAGLLVLSVGTLPGLLLFWPVFVTTKVISAKKKRQALAASVVKVRAQDVVASWKILVALGFVPALYTWYTSLVSFWLRYERFGGYYSDLLPWYMQVRTYIPDTVPLWQFAIGFFVLLVGVSFAALEIGDTGMDILKSLPPLLIALDPRSSGSLSQLRATRNALAIQVREVIDDLGEEAFPGFDASSIHGDTHREDAYLSQLKPIANL
ncbi:hypothetical protein BO82DRAFT_290880 [Aspergillus uvarum CBS 121591]|uniref:Phospholipid/glycerol acyltransferase domain-containing protein n=1 Tax=Aspergillus uvarum CBS 121591 TaxID=1448315 RepID=A0A319CSP6_9EURO|nr:hypothetical protein BO82DRAFT_290880 [Aspergillus uvarum CBS 121591]PYH78588.1 hypothetical protein BO82DRAFT_290880 [Aspergillus uvarum CBS 121591]